MSSNLISDAAGERKSHISRAEPDELHCKICSQRLPSPEFDLVARDGPFGSAVRPTKRNFFRCRNCGFVQADRYDPEQYQAYYSSLSLSYHQQHDEDSGRYEVPVRKIQSVKAARVLDWGCGNGEFLVRLAPNVEKFGVEPSRSAADEARTRGITVLSAIDLQTKQWTATFDAVTVLDVIEHTWDLAELRRSITKLLRPGGLLIVVTGDSGSAAATRLGQYWYYLHYSEHISFFNARSMKHWLSSDFESISFETITHHSVPKLQALQSLIRFVPVLISSRLAGNPLGRSPKLPASNDHMFVCAHRCMQSSNV